MYGLCDCMGRGEFNSPPSDIPMKITDLLRMILLSDFTIFKLISWALYSIYTWLLLWGLGTWGVGWIVVVLGFSQTDITVPQFPEAQQASRSIRGNGAVLTSPTLLLRLIPYTEVKGGGVWDRGKEWESRNNVTAVPLLTSLWCLMSVFVLCWQNYLFWGKGSGRVEQNKPLQLLLVH